MAKAYLYHRNTGHLRPLNNDTTFGRVKGDWTFPEDDVVSTNHGQFTYKGDQVYVIDLGSTNGTFVNRKDLEPNKPVLLHEMDEVLFGGQEFIFTTNSEISTTELEDKIANKKRDSLLGQVKKTREAKVAELEANAKQLLEQKEKWETLIQQKTEALSKVQNSFQTKLEEQRLNDQRISSLEQNMMAEQRKIEDSKKPYFQKISGLMDKLKLLEMANTEPEKQEELKKAVSEVEAEVAKREQQKQNLPNILKEFKAKTLSLTTEAQALKLKLQEVQADHDKVISQANAQHAIIHEQIMTLQEQLEKARAALKAV